MSFFDLENELPGWLDCVITQHPMISEISNHAVIQNLDRTSHKSYHMICADKGNMVSSPGSPFHQIWKFEAPQGNIRAYGKYLEFNNGNTSLEFWIGLVVNNGTLTLYLWVGIRPPKAVRTYLNSVLVKIIEKREYWYSIKAINGGQITDKYAEYCGCGSPPLDGAKLKELETAITEAIGDLLDAVEQAVQEPE
jgi:hypothetical protein